MKNLVWILALLLSLISAPLHAQSPSIVRSTEITTDDSGLRFYIHTVKAGETLYSLCRVYGVEQAELIRQNPALSTGLKAGQKLKIPFIEVAEKPNTASLAESKPLTLEHVVKRRETLYSISNLYEVSIADIKQANPEIFANGKDKIKRGQTLIIPLGLSGVKKNTKEEAKPTSDSLSSTANVEDLVMLCEGASYTLPINVALILPFDTDSFDERNPYNSFRFAEMYEGALIALESLRQQGVSVNLTVLDARKEVPDAIIRNPAVSAADIIIGPVYQEMFRPIADFAATRNIKIVSPLTTVDTGLQAYSNVFQVPVEFDEQVRQSVMRGHFDPVQSNIVMVWKRDDEASKNLRNLYRTYLPASDSGSYRNIALSRDSNALERLHVSYLKRQHNPVVKNLAYKVGLQPRENQGTLLKIFNSTLENKVIVASQDEPFVSELLANLKAFSDRYKCNITVYGTSAWTKFENVERKLFYDLKLHVAQPYYVNYNRDVVKNFVLAYREQYKTEPTQYAFQGYDVMLYFVSAIAQFGKKFEPCLPMNKVELLQSRYDFARPKLDGAYINNGVFLLRYTPWMAITSYD